MSAPKACRGVVLYIVGELPDTDAISRLLGMEAHPERDVHIGPDHPSNGGKGQQVIWRASTEGVVKSSDVDKHVEFILTELAQHARALQTLAAGARVAVIFPMPGPQPTEVAASLRERAGRQSVELISFEPDGRPHFY